MFEMDKFILQQRAFIQIRKRMTWLGLDTFEEVLLKVYKIKPIDSGKNNRTAIYLNEFCRLLEKLGCMRCNNKEDRRIVADEYGFLDDKRKQLVDEEVLEAAKDPNQKNSSRNVSVSHNQTG